MFITTPKEKKCRESRIIQTHRIFPADLNSFQALYGGKLMSFIDDTTSISAARHARRPVMTASTDELNFLHPLYENHSVCVEAYVTGTGRKSMEIFTKVIGEDLDTGERYLAATCFMTFVVVKTEENYQGVPQVIPETHEEQMITQGYNERRKKRLAAFNKNKELASHLSLSIPWMDEKGF